MGRFGEFKVSGLKELQKELLTLKKNEEQFVEDCAKELAARLLAKVIKRTPVGKYDKNVSFITADGKEVKFTQHTGKKGGTLRRGWTAGQKADAKEFADSVRISKSGGNYTVEIINPVEYASYVEYGHRKANGGWVNGHFMLTISEQEIRKIAPKVLEEKIKKFLGERMK